MVDELKQRELGNSEKEKKIQVKAKSIKLLPDAENNLLKLQVRGQSEASIGHRLGENLYSSLSRGWWRLVPSVWCTWPLSGRNIEPHSLTNIADLKKFAATKM